MIENCPFCGSDVLIVEGDLRKQYVYCVGCEASGSEVQSISLVLAKAKAIEVWNRVAEKCRAHDEQTDGGKLTTLEREYLFRYRFP